MRPPRLTLVVAACVLVVDALTKLLAARLLNSGQVVHVGPWLELDLYYNHAGAGNALTGAPVAVALLAAAAVTALTLLATRVRSPGLRIGLGLLLGGGIGNLVDRIIGAPGPLRGGVIDWLRPLNSSGSMNLADLAINLGVVVLAVAAISDWWVSRAHHGPVPQTGPTGP